LAWDGGTVEAGCRSVAVTLALRRRTASVRASSSSAASSDAMAADWDTLVAVNGT